MITIRFNTPLLIALLILLPVLIRRLARPAASPEDWPPEPGKIIRGGKQAIA